jgi:HEAT repeat protein
VLTEFLFCDLRRWDYYRRENNTVNELMAQLKAYDWGGNRGSLAGIDDLIVAAQRHTQKQAEIEQALLEVLQSDVKLPAKEYVCRKLALIGTARCVPVLAGMLTDVDLSDCARFALEAIPDASVDDALRAALAEATGNQLVGIVNTLGERRDKKAVAALTQMKGGTDEVLSRAAEAALRKIAS